MENERFLAEYLYKDDLKKIFAGSKMTLDFVFMATCYSEFTKNTWLEAGAHHVISIDKAEMIPDECILTFTKTFYQRIWKPRAKICECFAAA